MSTLKFQSIVLTCCLCFMGSPMLIFGQQTINGSITHGGLTRDYILYVPASYSPGTPAPLVFNFHGYGSNASQQIFYGDFRSIADTAGFLLVVPEGTLDNQGTTHFNVGWGGSSVDDVGFTAALIDSLAAEYSIDEDRVYSTGMSNGGFMSYILACELSDRIAAIASVTGSMNLGYPSFCNPTHPMPIMEIHGTSDGTVPYDGANWIESIDDVVSFWVSFNNADTPAVVTNVPDISTSDGCTAEHQLFENGNNGVEVEHYKIIGGGHTWPGTTFGGTGTNQDINASVEIWKFFAKYDINGRINPPVVTSFDEIEKQGNIFIYPNPGTDHISIRNLQPDYIRIELFNSIGMMVRTYKNGDDIRIVDMKTGIYLLKVVNGDGSTQTENFIKTSH